MRRAVVTATVVGSLICGSAVHAQSIDKKEFNVVGTWNFLTNFNELEKPFFQDVLPKATNGNFKGNIKALNELNLKGTELLRLLRQGVFDMAFALPIYVEDGSAIAEALDIAGVARDFAMAKDISELWMPEMQAVMKEKYGAIILGTHTWPEQNFYCRHDIKSAEDFKGKKIRVQGASQSDFVKALGATGVTIAFGEVVAALEKGVVDCGITGTMPAYKAKWQDVTKTLFRLPVGFTIGMLVANLSMWNKLSPDTQKLIQSRVKDLEARSWQSTKNETEDGIYCTTGTGNCPVGPPGRINLVNPSESDRRARDKALNEHVLKAWAKRCGEACAAKWTDLIGKKYGFVAKAN